ncbi:AP-1 complex subunit gamma-1 [Lamellibrachia satsuma]|nr:AP-1 complex subunit gamma-1 [Lamellibrachia satsuma]
MDIQSESGLRVLAVNILGRFLLNNDKNIRYVALNTLLKVVQADYNAVQRHRSTIVECLKDPDVSLKKRSMELCFALINVNNIRSLVKELLNFLDKCDPEFKADCSSNLVLAAERHSPNKRWHIDTVLKVLTSAGNYCRDDLVSTTIQLIQETTTLHVYTTQCLFKTVRHDTVQQPLIQVCCWCVGEYGDQLVAGNCSEDEPLELSEDDVLDMLEKIIVSSVSSAVTKGYALTAVVKLSTRFHSTIPRIRRLLSVFGCHTDIELQQRSVEYSSMFKMPDSIRTGLLEPMPLLEKTNIDQAMTNGDSTAIEEEDYGVKDDQRSNTVNKTTESQNILDLLSGPSAPPPKPEPSNKSAGSDLLDLLGDVDLSGGAGTLPVTGIAPMPAANLLDGITAPHNPVLNSQPNNVSTFHPVTAFEKSGLKIVFAFEKPDPQSPELTITLTATNSNMVQLESFIFQAAVPKSFHLQLMSPSGALLPPSNAGGCVTQLIKIDNPQKQPLRMRLRLSYTMSGTPVTEQAEVNNFPAQLWQ